MNYEFPQDLLNAEVAAICKRYRAAPDRAAAIVVETFAKYPDLLEKIGARYEDEDVTRWRDYKNAVKEARKAVYYDLRQYKRGQEAIARFIRAAESGEDAETVDALKSAALSAHASTAERGDSWRAFYPALFAIIGGKPESVLDLGCGLDPLTYPFGGATVRYVAVDRDQEAVAAVAAYAPYAQPTELIAICADLAEWRPDQDFELALMLKLIPVLARQHRDLLPELAAIPARYMAITASEHALTRRENIRRREERVLRDFIELTGRPVFGELALKGEFGFVLGPPA
jgi:16S rRNA (guanine(1405)-N(7))-methyltransferase